MLLLAVIPCIFSAQTFTPGDIAIVGLNVEHGTSHPFHAPDEVSLVSFVSIPVGTAIDITDNGWEQSYPGYWGNREGIIRIRRVNQELQSGQVFTFRGSGSKPEDFVVLPDSANWEVEVLDSTHHFNLTADDQVWILYGGEWSRGHQTDKASYSGYPIYGWSATGWAGDPGHGAHGTTSHSALYDHMECFYPHGITVHHKAKFIAPDNTADHRTWIKWINDPANWDTKNTTPAYHNSNPKYVDGHHFNVQTSHTNMSGRWIGDFNTNWFDCNNWSDHMVPGKNTDVYFDHNAQNYAVIEAGAPYAHLHDDTARCKNLHVWQDSILLTGSSTLLQITENLEINGGKLNSGDAQIIIKGNWTNHDSLAFLPGNSTVTFQGISSQYIINHSGPERFYKTVISNDSSVLMGSPLQINTLKFASGNLHLKHYNLLISGNITGGGPSGYCVTLDQPDAAGKLIMRQGTFPVGNKTHYTPTVISTDDSTKKFSVRTFSHLLENGYTGNILGGNIVPFSWAIEPVNQVDSADITLQWPEILETSGFTLNRALGDMIQNPGNGTGTEWSDWNFLITSSKPQGGNPYNIHTMNITQFGVFGVSADRCIILKPHTSPIYYFAH